MSNQKQQRQEGQQNQQRATRSDDQDGRSEALLPANTTDAGADGRFEVAEEVNMDQQSDAARRVGQPPADGATEAMAEALKPGTSAGKDGKA